MQEIPPPYERHIGRRKAAPDACPVCGTPTIPTFEVNSVYTALKALYTHPAHIWDRAVPGWKGFKTWYFVCTHVSALSRYVYGPSPFGLLLKTPDTWEGKYIQIPLAIGGGE